MAVNYSIKELLDVLRNSDDPEVLRDAMCRYGLVSKTLIEADAISPRVTDIMVAMIPDYVNARKANKTIQEALAGYDGAEADAEEAPAKEAPAKPKKAVKKPEPEPVVEDDEDEDTAVDYSSMKAKDLFELCKKRGIEAEPRHRTKYYIDILEKADAEAEKPAAVEDDDDDDDDDDWDI